MIENAELRIPGQTDIQTDNVPVRNKTLSSPAKSSPPLSSVARCLTLFWRRQFPRKDPEPLLSGDKNHSAAELNGRSIVPYL
jgi:hypothetical protein